MVEAADLRERDDLPELLSADRARLGGIFVVEEVLLFGVLVLVKHRLPRVFDRFTQQA